MTDVCRESGIFRKTGYRLMETALADGSRRPVRYANQLPAPVERLIVGTKREKPHWRARKIRELVVRRLAGDVRVLATRAGATRSPSPTTPRASSRRAAITSRRPTP